jgi:uncharacterized protein (DUF2252 family)
MTTARDEQRERGKALRSQVGRTAHGDWKPDAAREDPLTVLARENASRIQELVPIRMSRMVSSPFAFFRGAAGIMARDLATQDTTGVTVQACGDAHLSNFGVFASPERRLVFDLNDFDETAPGPWEWDVKRLAASAVIAGLDNGFAPDQCEAAARAAVEAYREWMRRYATFETLDVWYTLVDATRAVELSRSSDQRAGKRQLARTRERTSQRLLQRLATTDVDPPQIVDQPPLLTHIDTEQYRGDLEDIYRSYLESLPDERRVLLEQFHAVDFARKVVGVGSVGTSCFVALLLDDSGAPLFLQVKQASQSVIQQASGRNDFEHEGRRVVAGQRVMQATGDIFLGWTRAAGLDGYVRQLADMKGSVRLDRLTPSTLVDYVEVCGWTLARAHARSGSAAVIGGYLGGSDVFDRAVAAFAVAYARQNVADHARLSEAIADGSVAATPEPD